MIGLTPARFPVSEIFWGARKYLEALAARRPVVVCIEDVHNAEATFLDLVDHVLDSDGPAIGRAHHRDWPARLREKRPAGASGRACRRSRCRPLEPCGTARLVEVLLGGAVETAVTRTGRRDLRGQPAVRRGSSSRCSWTRASSASRRPRGRPSGDLAGAAVPPTIQALLAARLDDLSREERAIMEPASVIGLSLPEPAIEELVPETLRPLRAEPPRA